MNIRKKYDYDLIVIGSGAGGSVAAHYVNSLGKRVAVIEKAEIGGECPNWACVPTKALLRSAKIYQQAKNGDIFGVETKGVRLNWSKTKKWKDLVVSRTGASHGEEIFEKEGLNLIRGKAEFVSPHEVEVNEKIYSAQNILIATGKKPVLDIALEKSGVKVENNEIVTNKYLQTTVKHIYAAGDLVGPYQFTHTAEYQSYVAGQNAFGRQKIKADYSVIPRCVFIEPEIASVGLGELTSNGPTSNIGTRKKWIYYFSGSWQS